MQNLFQRNWYTEVRRGDNGLLNAKTSYVDTYWESVAYLIVDVNSFPLIHSFNKIVLRLIQIFNVKAINPLQLLALSK